MRDPDEPVRAEGVPLDHERDGRGVVALGATRHCLPQPEHTRTIKTTILYTISLFLKIVCNQVVMVVYCPSEAPGIWGVMDNTIFGQIR